MKGSTIEIIKDLVLSILIVISIAIILSIVFYDKIALTKIIPKAEAYTLTDEMQKELLNSQIDDAQEVIINYYIDASDLKKYEKTNEYVKGKSNPFAEISNIEATTGDNNISYNTNNNTSEGFYEDDGTK